MELTQQLKDYLKGFDFNNAFEVANAIMDYKEGKHEDNREIPREIYDLAHDYIKQENLYYLEGESKTTDSCGHCPYCNSWNLDYWEIELEGENVFYPWTCCNCGATGEEWYYLEFTEQIGIKPGKKKSE